MQIFEKIYLYFILVNEKKKHLLFLNYNQFLERNYREI